MKVFLEEMAQPYLLRVVQENKDEIEKRTLELWHLKKEELELDGFRKGKVPQNVAEAKFGFQNLYNEYINELILQAVQRTTLEHNETVVDLQQVYPEKISKEGIVMQAIAYLKPKISVDYSNIEVEKQHTTVTDADIDAEIETNRAAQALSVPIVDRGLEFGDSVTLSFTGYLDGVPFKGGSVSRQQLTLSSTQFIPGFAEQILGMMPETSKTIQVTFPEDYSATHLAGKLTTFDITVHEFSRRELPALDDEFAKTCGYDSLELLRTGTRTELENRQLESIRAQTESLIITQLLSRAEVAPIPQSMVKRYLDQMLQQQLNQLNVSEKDYFAKTNSDRDKFDQTYYHIAKRDIKVQLILDNIALKENFTVSDQEYEDYMSTEASRYGYSVEQLKQAVTREQAEGRVKMRKAYDFLLATVQYVEQPLAKEVISNLEVEAHSLT